ncbi:tetratricopeptide repeat protein [Parvularcula lutaonensis]|uniref:Tetratricopeptide repeat protein n=1 Tax=Parvularcula lutaonensis TaxID=491923 RepID=A0ABV7M9N9_9PROT|nr:tetratricopeptide repeat protein [Parvularcula lutaonensis]
MSMNERMTKLRKPASAFLAVLMTAGMVLPIDSAFAQNRSQEEEDRRRSRQTLTERSGRALAEAINLINEEPPKTQEALNTVNALLQRNLPPYDRATALEVRGQLYFQLDNLDAALRDFVEVLNLDVLPSDRQRQIRRNVAQLYYTQERYDEAIRFMEQYIREAGAEAEANDYFILAAAYVQNNQFSQARGPAETAVRLDQQSGNRNKQFYDLLNLIYNELNLEAERGRLLETMVEYFPGEASYWEQLAGAYSQANRRADALAALEVAYKAGLIDEEDKIVALAQYYYDQNNPFRGAQLLEAEMNAGNVKRDLSNLELLAQLWAAAREQEKAIAILNEAAPKRSDGRLYYQLGQSYLADENYDRAISNLRQALRRGGLDDREVGNAYVLLGTALFQKDSDSREGRQAARAEFVRARDYPSAARTANSWIEYIDTIETTLKRQAEVEFSQAVERQRRQIDRCKTILDVIELGGQTEVPEEQLAACRELVAKVEAGATPESLVREARGEAEGTEGDDTASEEEAG